MLTTPLEKAENSFDFLTRIFGFMETHGVAAVLFMVLVCLAAFMGLMLYLQRGQIISAQKELNDISREAVNALNNSTHAIEGIKESFERFVIARLGGRR